ncbi:MAG: hypothetical protein IKD81_02870 [Eubacteriaceae bacterium]|nr:hypothetical protein [Eubacteriaceae bacterium]
MPENTVTISCQNGQAGYRLKIEAALTGNTSGNMREVSCTFRILPTGYGGFYDYSEKPVHTALVVGGSQKSYNEWSELWPMDTWKTVNSWSGYVTAGQTVTVTGRLTLRSDYQSGYSYLPVAGSVSVSLTLDALQSRLGTVADFVFDDAACEGIPFSVPVTKYDQSMYDVLAIKCGDGQIAVREDYSSGTVTLSPSEIAIAYGLMSTSNSAEWTFLLKTYTSDGGSLVGSSETTAQASLSQEGSAPEFSAEYVSVRDTCPDTLAITGDPQKAIKGHSVLSVEILSEAQARKGAQISSYTFSMQGTETQHRAAPSSSPVVLTFPDSSVLTVIVTDSRGNSTAVNVSVPMTDYMPPSVNIFRLQRVSPAYTGTEAFMEFEGTLSLWEGLELDNGIESLSYRCREASSSPFGPEQVPVYDYSGGTFSFSGNIPGSFDVSSRYEFELTVADRLGSVSVSAYLISAMPTLDMDVNRRIVSVGKTIEGSTQGSLELAHPLSVRYGGTGGSSFPSGYFVTGNGDAALSASSPAEAVQLLKSSLLELIYPVGSIYMSTDQTSPQSLFGGSWERIKDRFLLSAGDSYAAGAVGGEESHVLSLNEIPSHSHVVPGTTANNYGSGGTVFENWVNRTRDRDARTASAGSGAAHNNMPPYLAVYVWKRTA